MSWTHLEIRAINRQWFKQCQTSTFTPKRKQGTAVIMSYARRVSFPRSPRLYRYFRSRRQAPPLYRCRPERGGVHTLHHRSNCRHEFLTPPIKTRRLCDYYHFLKNINDVGCAMLGNTTSEEWAKLAVQQTAWEHFSVMTQRLVDAKQEIPKQDCWCKKSCRSKVSR